MSTVHSLPTLTCPFCSLMSRDAQQALFRWIQGKFKAHNSHAFMRFMQSQRQ